jgi:hypothetical protein
LGKENTLLEKRFSTRNREQPLCENNKPYLERDKAKGGRLFPHGERNKPKRG